MNQQALERVDLVALSRKTKRFSGADLENLCREAAMASLRRDIASAAITEADFDAALALARATNAAASRQPAAKPTSSRAPRAGTDAAVSSAAAAATSPIMVAFDPAKYGINLKAPAVSFGDQQHTTSAIRFEPANFGLGDGAAAAALMSTWSLPPPPHGEAPAAPPASDSTATTAPPPTTGVR